MYIYINSDVYICSLPTNQSLGKITTPKTQKMAMNNFLKSLPTAPHKLS